MLDTRIITTLIFGIFKNQAGDVSDRCNIDDVGEVTLTSPKSTGCTMHRIERSPKQGKVNVRKKWLTS